MPASEGQSERRRAPRVHLNSLVTVQEEPRDDPADGISTLGRTLDLSEGGLCLELSLPLDADTSVRLRVVVQQALLVATGTVRWVRSAETGAYHHGIGFTDLGSRGERVLRSFVQGRLAEPN